MGLLRKGQEPELWAWGKLRPGLSYSALSAQDTGGHGEDVSGLGLLEAQLGSHVSRASGHLQTGSPVMGYEGHSC